MGADPCPVRRRRRTAAGRPDEPTTRHAAFPSGALRMLGAAAVVGAATTVAWTFGHELSSCSP
ncbi:hypothetical protein GS571_23155 [Rhodococcus hoagii]|nr:hypothetical protein [Prescottella equi]